VSMSLLAATPETVAPIADMEVRQSGLRLRA
jgi:hypothetical protein